MKTRVINLKLHLLRLHIDYAALYYNPSDTQDERPLLPLDEIDRHVFG